MVRSFAPRRAQSACFFIDELSVATAGFVSGGAWDWLAHVGHQSDAFDFQLEADEEPLAIWLDVSSASVAEFLAVMQPFLPKYSATAEPTRSWSTRGKVDARTQTSVLFTALFFAAPRFAARRFAARRFAALFFAARRFAALAMFAARRFAVILNRKLNHKNLTSPN